MDILRRGPRLGLAFSGVVSLGNCSDIGVCDLLEYFLADAETRVVGLYVESVKNGRRLFELLKADGSGKPVVILKGGRSQQGQRAAASHTGALAGDDRVWRALSKQTGAVLVDGLIDFLSVLAAFQAELARPLRRVASSCSATAAASAYSPLTRSPTLASTWRQWVERRWQSSRSWHFWRGQASPTP